MIGNAAAMRTLPEIASVVGRITKRSSSTCASPLPSGRAVDVDGCGKRFIELATGNPRSSQKTQQGLNRRRASACWRPVPCYSDRVPVRTRRAAEDDTRQVISLTVDAESVTEGALAGITLTRSGNIDEGLSLTAHVLETGAMLAFPAETPDGKPIIRDLQFSASSTTATLQEATVDDTTDEPDSEITFCPDTAG